MTDRVKGSLRSAYGRPLTRSDWMAARDQFSPRKSWYRPSRPVRQSAVADAVPAWGPRAFPPSNRGETGKPFAMGVDCSVESETMCEMGIVRRKDLKPARAVGDDAFMAAAAASATRYRNRLERARRAAAADAEWRARDRAVKGRRAERTLDGPEGTESAQ